MQSSLRERDGLLVNNWYIACLSSEIQESKPIGRKIYDIPLVLFRDSLGEVQCFKDQCLHRHAPLSEGVVIDGMLSCPYHGWTYNSSGQCVHVPSEGRSFCKNPGRSLKRFYVAEQDDCVWVWMGNSEPKQARPPYRFPYWNSKESSGAEASKNASAWHCYFMITDFENEVTQLVENFMDVPHTVFVHSGWFRNSSKRAVPIEVTTTQNSVLVNYQQKNDKIGFTGSFLNPKKRPMYHTDLFVMPNITRVDYVFGERTESEEVESGFVISSQCTPVSEMKSRVYTEIAYRLPYSDHLQPILNPFLKFYTRKVIGQDVEIMKIQGRNIAEFRNNETLKELSFENSEADILHKRIEEMRMEATGIAGATEQRMHSKQNQSQTLKERAQIWI